MLDDKRKGPGSATEAPQNAVAASRTMIPDPGGILRHPKAVAPAYAVLVVTTAGHLRRQVYLSLHSATKALARHEAAGRVAKCILVELVPVPHAPAYVIGGDDQ